MTNTTRQGNTMTGQDLAQETTPMPVMLSIKETVDRLNRMGVPTSYSLIRSLCFSGEIDRLKLGRRYFINWDKLLARCQGGTLS